MINNKILFHDIAVTYLGERILFNMAALQYNKIVDKNICFLNNVLQRNCYRNSKLNTAVFHETFLVKNPYSQIYVFKHSAVAYARTTKMAVSGFKSQLVSAFRGNSCSMLGTQIGRKRLALRRQHTTTITLTSEECVLM